MRAGRHRVQEGGEDDGVSTPRTEPGQGHIESLVTQLQEELMRNTSSSSASDRITDDAAGTTRHHRRRLGAHRRHRAPLAAVVDECTRNGDGGIANDNGEGEGGVQLHKKRCLAHTHYSQLRGANADAADDIDGEAARVHRRRHRSRVSSAADTGNAADVNSTPAAHLHQHDDVKLPSPIVQRLEGEAADRLAALRMRLQAADEDAAGMADAETDARRADVTRLLGVDMNGEWGLSRLPRRRWWWYVYVADYGRVCFQMGGTADSWNDAFDGASLHPFFIASHSLQRTTYFSHSSTCRLGLCSFKECPPVPFETRHRRDVAR